MDDTNVSLGMVAHKATCRCTECELERVTGERNKLKRLLDEALRQMSDFHASFSPANDADLTPRTSPAAMRRFVDELASLHYQRHRL